MGESNMLAASFGAVPAARPLLAGARATSGFAGFVRTGAEIETKAMTGLTGEAGGYAVPREIDAAIDATLAAVSPIRAIANVVKVGSAGYRKLVAKGGTPSGWSAETTGRGETATPTFFEVAPPMGELYANPSASQAMLDDAGFDVEGWLAEEIAREFARAEGAAFVAGSGVNRPKGFLAAPTAATADAVRAFGTLQHVASGAAGGFAANPEEKLIDLVQALRQPYRQGACFVMNSATLARIRKFKTSDGEFLWAAGIAAGQPATLLGYPVVEAEDIPPADPAAGECWVVGNAPSDAWRDHAREIAGWTEAGWRFVAPWSGAALWNQASGMVARFVAGEWVEGAIAGKALILNGNPMLDAPLAPIAVPAASADGDGAARAAIAAIVAALEHHRLLRPA